MTRLLRTSRRKLALAALALSACTWHGVTPVTLSPSTTLRAGSAEWRHGDTAPQYIKHIIILIHENRSFDDLFATFPGADGATQGKMSNGHIVKLKKANLAYPYDLGHSFDGFLRDYDRGKMDGFDLEGSGHGGKAGTAPYQYVDPKQIAPYWHLAKSYVLADHMFQTQGSGSFTAHQDLIAGGTAINSNESLIDFPSASPWGCDAPPGTTTTLLTIHHQVLYQQGPFPCFHYATLRDLLDAKYVSWKYYSPRVIGSTGAIWNAFDAIKAVRYGSEWSTNITRTDKAVFRDIAAGTLPSVAWLVPDLVNSDHPGNHSNTGPSWVATLVNTIGQSQYWSSTAIVLIWDDWGGFYDNEPPPFRDRAGGLGFRVPMILVSAYARKGYISHTQYEFGSVLRFIENNWRLGRLGTSDERATSIGDCFDFSQPPRKFHAIQAQYSRAYFERQPASNLPVDTE